MGTTLIETVSLTFTAPATVIAAPETTTTTAAETTTTTTAAETTTTTTAAETTTTTTAAPNITSLTVNGSAASYDPSDSTWKIDVASDVMFGNISVSFNYAYSYYTYMGQTPESTSSNQPLTRTTNTVIITTYSSLGSPTAYMLEITKLAATTTTTTTTITITTAAPNVICFLGNAPVLTPTGPQRIDSLKEGDLVLTEAGAPVPIQRVKAMRVRPGPSTNPYVIAKGQYGATEELLISPRHCVAVGGQMIEARDLGLPQKTMKKPFTYYNIELPGWANMRVAGVEVESLAPAKRIMATKEQVLTALKTASVKTKIPITATTLKTLQRVCYSLGNEKLTILH